MKRTLITHKGGQSRKIRFVCGKSDEYSDVLRIGGPDSMATRLDASILASIAPQKSKAFEAYMRTVNT